jgi:uncharacterized damage-inducible protein DinB
VLNAVRTLYAYNAWANARILETAERLKLRQLIAAGDGGASVRDILVHTAWAQWLWLERWQGNSPREQWNPAEFPYVATLRARWMEVEGATQRYLASLDESTLADAFSYVNTRGETWTYPRWEAMLHQVNHATQHRGEAALLMTGYGCSPGDLDLLVYEDELAAKG